MGQYMLNPKDDLKNLELALTQYPLDSIKISPKSYSNRNETLHENLENKILNFTEENGLTFYIENKKFFNFPLEKNSHPFKVEYQDEKKRRLWIRNYHPNDPHLPKPTYSALRKVVDDLFLEIYFKGKIRIEPSKEIPNFWKII